MTVHKYFWSIFFEWNVRLKNDSCQDVSQIFGKESDILSGIRNFNTVFLQSETKNDFIKSKNVLLSLIIIIIH